MLDGRAAQHPGHITLARATRSDERLLLPRVPVVRRLPEVSRYGEERRDGDIDPVPTTALRRPEFSRGIRLHGGVRRAPAHNRVAIMP